MSDNPRINDASPSLRGRHIVIIGGSLGVGYPAADCALAEGAAVTSVADFPTGKVLVVGGLTRP